MGRARSRRRLIRSLELFVQYAEGGREAQEAPSESSPSTDARDRTEPTSRSLMWVDAPPCRLQIRWFHRFQCREVL